MQLKDRYVNIFLAVMAPFAIAAIYWAFQGVSTEPLDYGLITLGVLTIFSSCYLRIQLPRVNIHLTISDALIIIAILQYGGQAALIIAVVETALASLNLRRQGVSIKVKTVFINVFVAALAVFTASKAVTFIFGSTELVMQRGDLPSFIWMLAVLALSLFLVNSGLVAVFSAIKNQRKVWLIWTDNCFDALVIYLSGGVMAGLIIKSLSFEKANIYVFAAVVLFFGIVYLTFRKFVEDVKKNVEVAKQAEQTRAEQAEQHIRDLQHYVEDIERSSVALQESHEAFRHAAYHDALTGLPNRNYFIDTLKGLLQESRESDECNFAVLFLDLNRFKTINDSLGHSLGDRLIKNVGKRLSGMVREEDMVARFSGDKFGVILTDLLSRDEATSFADRLAKRLSEPYTLDGRQVFPSAKIGIAFGNSQY